MNKNNKNNNKAEAAVRPLSVEIGPAQRTILAMGRGLVPRGNIQELTHLGRALAHRAREGGEERERSTLAGMLATCELADKAIAHNATIEVKLVAQQRDDVVVQATTIKATLARWAVGHTPLAKAAAEVQRALFPATENFGHMDHRVVWQVMVAKARQYEDDGALRKALAVFVPEAATAALFAANDALGAVLARPVGEPVTAVDLAAVAMTLRARAQRYAAAVIAAVDPDDAESVRSAERALQPLAELRAQQVARRRKLAKAKASGAGARPPETPEVVVPDEGEDDATG